MVFPGFNNSKKRGTISRGDFDRDGVKNRKDCEPLNFKKQGPAHEEVISGKNPYAKGSQAYTDFAKADKKFRCPKCGARTFETEYDRDYNSYEECSNCDWRRKR